MVPYLILAGAQLASGYFASQNIRATAALNKDIAEMNAEFAELDAYDSELEGMSAATRYQSVIDNTLAEQQTALAAADVDISYGSAASIGEETKFIGQLNQMEITKQAQEQALGYKRQSRDFKLSGFMQSAEGKSRASQAMASGITSAASTGLTGYERSRSPGGSGGSKPKVDRAGGTTSYSTDYLDM
jgi:hypothetical protein